jgi:hypothetical protein
MNLANKSFKDNRTGEIVKVIDAFENIAILENKQKLDVRKLTDPNLYTEQIDVNSFFNTQSSYNFLAEKIKNIPTENIRDDVSAAPSVRAEGMQIPGNQLPNTSFQMPTERAATIISEEQALSDERAELAKKYGVADNRQHSIETQNQAFAKILGSDEDLPVIVATQRNEVSHPIHPIPGVNSTFVEKNHIPTSHVGHNDPIRTMFKSVKRNVSFKMNLEISNKIPRIDFIEMMEDSYDVSIIDYLAEEFTQNILNDPSQIKEMIKDKIKKIVYGSGVMEKDTKKEPTEKKVKKVVSKKVVKSDPSLKEGEHPIKNIVQKND